MMQLRMPNIEEMVPVHMPFAETVKATVIDVLDDGRIVAQITQPPFTKGATYKLHDQVVCERQRDALGTIQWEALHKYEPSAE